jgi:hypothetical protein
MYQKNETFNSGKMSSFQLGILALSLILTGTSPFITATDKDPFYRFISQEQY